MEIQSHEDSDRARLQRIVLTILFSVIVSLICITINSKNSFLYKIQDADDAQCFMTVARCMLRGDVLYKDVYEHKGIVLYVLYMLAHIITPNSFVGVYILEVISFSFFIAFLIKILRLFCKNDAINLFFVSLIAVRTTSVLEFRAGGQCEEFVLPLLAVSIYLVLKQSLLINDKDLSKNSIIIGLCFSIIFWMKYTLTGMYIGFAIGILVIGIRNKDLKFIVKNGLFFLLGTCIGTLPVLLYFGMNNALYDLWDVYFYTLLFKYGKSRSLGLLKIITQIAYLFRKRMVVAIPAIAWLFISNKQFPKEVKLQSGLLTTFAIIGCASGVLQSYTWEVFHAYTVFGFIGIICIFKNLITKENVKKERAKNKKSIAGITIWLKKSINVWREEWEKEIRPKFKSSFFKLTICIAGVMLFLFTVWLPSPYRMYIGYDWSDYQLYQMKECIEERVPDNPKILYFDCTDMGLFFLTKTYPLDKYFGGYTIYSPEDLDYYNKYIITKEADFVASREPQPKLETYGYQLVYSDIMSPFVSDVGLWSYYLYAREDLN